MSGDSPRRDRGVDGVRGVAALTVVGAHILHIFYGGPYRGDGLMTLVGGLLLNGVVVFFAISGFLLYRPFAQAAISGERLNLRAYARNRALRIFPAYVVVLLCASWVMGAAITAPRDPANPNHDTVGFLTDPLLFLANLTLTQGYFPGGFFTGLWVSWSLVTELAFYAALPLLGALAVVWRRRMGGHLCLFVPGLIMIAIGWSTRYAVFEWSQSFGSLANAAPRSGTWVGVLNYSLLGTADLFGWGMLAAAFVVVVRNSPDLQRRAISVATPLFWIAAVALFPAAQIRMQGTCIALATGCLLFILAAGVRKGPVGRPARLLDLRILDRAGMISYSIYLWHYPIGLFLAAHVPALKYASLPGILLAFAVTVAATWAVSELTYRFVEAPALRRKRSMR